MRKTWHNGFCGVGIFQNSHRGNFAALKAHPMTRGPNCRPGEICRHYRLTGGTEEENPIRKCGPDGKDWGNRPEMILRDDTIEGRNRGAQTGDPQGTSGRLGEKSRETFKGKEIMETKIPTVGILKTEEVMPADLQFLWPYGISMCM